MSSSIARRGAHLTSYVLGLACLRAFMGCGGDDGDAGARTTTFVPGPVTVVAPEHGAAYEGVAPAIVAVLDPTLGEAEIDSVVVRVNDVDVSDRIAHDGGALFVTGLGDVVREGANEVVVTYAGTPHAIAFTFACGALCAHDGPRLDGPSEIAAGAQRALFGANLGTAGDRRLLYLDGVGIEIRGGRWASDIVPFIGPPSSVATSVEVVVEVNGHKSNTLVIDIVEPAPLDAEPDVVVADFVAGLEALGDAYRAFPVTATGDPEADLRVAALRAALEDELADALGGLTSTLGAMPSEAKVYLAQFLRQGALDTLFAGWASDLPKVDRRAEGVPAGFDSDCEGSVLRAYRTLAFMKFIQDTVSSLTLGLAVVAALYPPALALIGPLVAFSAEAGNIIGVMELFVATVLPDVEAATIDLPEAVQRSDEVRVTGTVTFVWDPRRKLDGITGWALNRTASQAIDALFARLQTTTPFGAALKTLAETTVARLQDLANHLGTWASDTRAGSATAPPMTRFTVPAYPLFLDFRAERFELVAGDDDGACVAIGRWKEDVDCDVEDAWTIGRSLAQTSWYERALGSHLGRGTVTSGDPVLGPDPYDDPEYGARLEAFGRDAGCARMQHCYEEYEGECGLVSALGPDADCLNMFFGSRCPSAADYDAAYTLCLACYQ